MAKKLGSPNYFDYYVNGKGSGGVGSSPDLFKQYTGIKLDPSANDRKKWEEDQKKLQDKTTENINKLKRENSNYTTRLNDAGVNVKKETDTRNPIEKALNLNPNNNALWDVVQTINRGLNGVSNMEKQYLKNIMPNKQKYKQGKLTDQQYSDIILQQLKNTPHNFMDGLKGKADVTSADVLGQMGMKKGWGRTLSGLGIDMVQDPFNAVGGPIFGLAAKGISKGAGLAGKVIENASPDGALLMQGVKATKNKLGEAFNPDKYTPQPVKDFFQRTEATKNGLQEKAFKIVNHLVNTVGMNKGEDIARVLENNLNIKLSPNEVVNKLNDLGSNEKMLIRGNDKAGGLGQDFTTLKNMVNKTTTNSPKFQNTMKNLTEQQAKNQDIIKTVADKHGGLDKLDATVKMQDQRAERLLSLNGTPDLHTPLSDLIQNNNKISDVYNQGQHTMSALKDVMAKDEYKAFKTQLSDSMKAKNALAKAQDVKANIVDKSVPIKVDKLSNGVKYSQLPDQAKTAVASLLKESKQLKNDIPHIQDELHHLQQNNVHLNHGSIDKAVKAKEEELQVAKQRSMDIEKQINQHVMDSGIQRGWAVTKTGKSAVAKALMDNNGKVVEDFLHNTGKIKPTDNLTKKQITDLGNKSTVQIPRLARKMSDNPQVHQAADRMNELYTELRDYAKSSKIDIPNFDGYLTHAITDEYRKLTAKAVSSDGTAKIGGDAKVIQKRNYLGSVEDVNQAKGQNVFHDNAYKAFVEGYKRVSNYVAAEGFVQHVLGNYAKKVSGEDLAKFKNEKGILKLPEGKRLISAKDFKFYQVLDKEGLKHLAVKPSDQFIVDKGSYALMKRYDHINSTDGLEQFFTWFDKHMKFWKGTQLLSLGYHVRNIMGADFNRHVAGMSLADMSKHDLTATKDLLSYDHKILPKVVKGEQLDAKEKAIYDRVNEYTTSGLRDSSRYRNDFSQFNNKFDKFMQDQGKQTAEKTSVANKVITGAVKGFDGVTGASFKAGATADDIKRYAMYQWAKENPAKIKLFGGSKNPVEAVKAAMFDYQDLTEFERKFMKRIMPFYTFSRKNVPFQFQQLLMNPVKYSNTAKVIQSMYQGNGLDKQDVPPYLKDALGVPTGKNTILKTYLPMSDIGNFGSPMSALKQAVSMETPLAKLPVEIASNYDFFKNQKIQDFKGQKTDQYLGLASPKVAHSLDELGFRNPDKWLKTGASAISDIKAGKVQGNVLDRYVSSLFTKNDKKKVEEQRLWTQRDLLDGIKKKAQQNGIEVRSINEIKKSLKELK
ncbi:MAG TPA: hypothetical protein VK190_11375 [Pseudoneobacillus sp.]|nr:hypothetical protein [Pseudoneobacillus sp.]